jgi:hypothetical protein
MAVPPELVVVISRWPSLPSPIIQAILALVRLQGVLPAGV